MKKTNSVLASAITSVLLLSGHAIETSHAQTMSISFDMPSQPLVEALRAIANQTQQNVFFDPQVVAGHQAPALKAALSAEEALERALSGSGLTYRRIDEKTVSIVPVMQTTSAATKEKRKASGWVKTAAVDSAVANEGTTLSEGNANDQIPGSGPKSDTAAGRSPIKLEEVIVTGSHIRGAQNLSSPVITFTREDIERGGYTTTEQLIQTLPQNLSNVSDMTLGDMNGGPSYAYSYGGSAVNLRGLGGDATLVLLNGRRLASAGNGSFIDVSLVPLGAIERIDVLTDGASAIYGADAVGGVVNLVLRKDFEGGETRLRYGSVTEGSHDELQAGQVIGHAWDSGQALVSYEYFRRTPLKGADRSFFDPSQSYTGMELIPAQTRHGFLGVVEQRLADRFQISGDLFFGQRGSDFVQELGPLIQIDTTSRVKQYGGAFALSADVGSSWQIRLTGLMDRSDSEMQLINERPSGIQVLPYSNEFTLQSADLAADGALWRVPGGDVRLAMGAQIRREELTEINVAYPARLERQISAGYAELIVPWIGSHNSIRGIRNLEMTLAARYEDYSDFGGTFNPKLGLAWMPFQGLNLRGTWGTSFKAPLLTQLNPGIQSATVYSDLFLGSTGEPAPALYLWGNGLSLGPEESRNWTIGFDVNPTSLPGLSFSSTYFDIDYTDRIRSPFSNAGLPDPAVTMDPLYSAVVTHNPDPGYVQEIIANNPNSRCVRVAGGTCVLDPSQVASIVDARHRNLAGLRMSGFDVSINYAMQTAFGELGARVAAAKLLRSDQQLVPGAPETSEMNDVWRPIDLRLRGSLSLSRNGLDLIGTLNYADGYHDSANRYLGTSIPRSSVASWSTFDLTLSYDFRPLRESRWFRQSTIVLSAVNVFDRDPPYVASGNGLYYDGVNANPRGRFLSLQLTGRW